MTEDEMVGWHHGLDEHEFEQAPGVSERQGSLVCCSPQSPKESDMTEHTHPHRYPELGCEHIFSEDMIQPTPGSVSLHNPCFSQAMLPCVHHFSI